MKKKNGHLWASALVVVMMGVMASKASAVNPAIFSVSMVTGGEDVFFTSPVAVDTGFASYDYTVDFTSIIAVLDVFGVPTNQDVTSQVADVAGNFVGLPNTLVNDMISEPGVIDMDVLLTVDAAGVSNASLTNIVFGQILGFDIIGLSLDADVSITGVPEPATLGLLGMGGTMLLLRRRQRVNI